MNTKTWLFIPLIIIGATWGLTIPAIKVAVSGGYPVLGVLFWQVFLAAIVALILFLPKRRILKLTQKRLILFGWIMAFGTILPGIITYSAAFPPSSWCNGHHDSYGPNIHNANSYFDWA
jgi:EamA-like transporter family.